MGFVQCISMNACGLIECADVILSANEKNMLESTLLPNFNRRRLLTSCYWCICVCMLAVCV